MASVTRRITAYNKEVGQPRGGLLHPKLFTVEQLNDGLGVLDGKLENLSPGIVGIAVDNLTRLARVRPAADEASLVSALVDVFGASITGAMRISEKTENTSAATDAKAALQSLASVERADGTLTFAIDETAVMVACQLATYDVGLRAGVQFYNPESTLLVPDAVTTSHVLTMVDRTSQYFDEHGPIVSDGFFFADKEAYVQGDRGGYTDLVTSGDGDLLTFDTLWDVKTNGAKPTKDHTLQVLMYFLMGKESGLPMFETQTYIGIFNARLGLAYRMAASDVPADVLETVRRDVIGYRV